ncbi:glutathione S-transferase [Bordetella sp. FB-8]|uniref:glutathione S-transferase n=1 Tax=Bordetella sp. FB-8 TaxID=1159870 RepID=UPI00036CB18E|nr:glutathione S-transferase [Bordetella sp. FB-8]
MQLIGMLDSPYVRRTAIGLKLLGIPFEHRSVSVLSTFDQFHALNPVVKAPTLILDDGQVLMDSTLILDYAQRLAGPSAAIFPADLAKLARAIRLTGLALAACEKTVQIVYERKLRPADKLHQPWLDRVRKQLLAAYAELEKDLRAQPLHGAGQALGHDGVAVAVAWGFTQMMVSDVVPTADYPRVQAFSAHCEQLAVFRETPAT